MLSSVREIFAGAAAKYLTTVDADPLKSNQHEIGGLVKVGFKAHLGEPSKDSEKRFKCLMAYLTDESEPETLQDTITWYDTRRNNPQRAPEYRLYYKSNSVTERIEVGDFFLIAKMQDNTLILLFTPPGTIIESQLRHLFGLPKITERFSPAEMPNETLLFPIKLLLEEIGIAAFDEASSENDLRLLIEKYPNQFPKTSEFSALARSLTDHCFKDDPDTALTGWMEREEALFRAYERHIVAEKLRSGFGDSGDDVDEFISFSLSVQNRRKSRVGYAFENHLTYLFEQFNLPFEKGSGTRVTENKAKPDFLFPCFDAYHDYTYPVEKIFLLGAKTTCKDRWRQVLSEGDRLNKKYLITLEAGITTTQTDEMKAKDLQLIIPNPIKVSYTSKQQNWLLSVSDFISLIESRV